MSFLTALSGLNAAQSSISTTSNNIANAGTIGFHGSRSEFADIYTSSPYSNPRTQIGSGVQLASVSRSFAQGSVTVTANTLDLALQGPGFFRLQSELEGGQAVYTRAGAFGLNADGHVVTSGDRYLTAYPTAENGALLDTLRPQPLRVPMTRGEPTATGTLSVTLGFPAATPAGGQAAVPPVAGFDPADGSTFAFATPVNILDETGQPRDAMLHFVQTAAPDAANPLTTYSVHMVVDGMEMPTADGAPATVSFDSDGLPAGGTLAPLGFTIGMQPLSVNLDGSALGMGAFAVRAMDQDGTVPRSLSGLEIDEGGTVWASYGGSEAVALGRIAVANFTNPAGLKSIGGAGYTQTRDSGPAAMGEAAINGFGSVRSGALEQANVDLTEELVNLITAQRNYQASAKALEANQTLSQTIMNMRG